MEFLKKYGIWILLAVVVIFMFVKFTKKTDDTVATSTVNQTAIARPTGATPSVNSSPITAVTSATVGTPGANTSLTRSQCRATCKGKCGTRPIIPIGQKGRSAKQCWDNCRNTYCSWVTDDL